MKIFQTARLVKRIHLIGFGYWRSLISGRKGSVTVEAVKSVEISCLRAWRTIQRLAREEGEGVGGGGGVGRRRRRTGKLGWSQSPSGWQSEGIGCSSAKSPSSRYGSGASRRSGTTTRGVPGESAEKGCPGAVVVCSWSLIVFVLSGMGNRGVSQWLGLFSSSLIARWGANRVRDFCFLESVKRF